jgi:uncharacterized lipoprotein
LTSQTDFDTALRRLARALDELETSVQRRREADRGRGDMETEFSAMQDDRQRLAGELDEALARSARSDAALADISRRLGRAMDEVRTLLAAEPAAQA